ncbi:MAG TPA: DUF1090 domain-containing protein [Desulfobulbus sp.]|nr:DUF1090 domain-containing protein [Desulfobulbus sp.]
MRQKKILTIAAATASLLFLVTASYAGTPADCAGKTGCAKKICEIEAQITIAQAHNNTGQVNRLKAELTDVKANCTKSSVKAESAHDNARIDRKIADAKEDMAEASEKMEKAKAQGREDKVLKYQHKIEEKQMKIKHLEEKKGGK